MKLIKGNRHRVVDQVGKSRTFPRSSKYREGFAILVTNHINECQECYDEHAERYEVFKIKILHKHHLHFMQKLVKKRKSIRAIEYG